MFKRTYLGLEIRRDGLRAIALQRAGGGVALVGGQTLKLSDGILHPLAQEPNIRQPELFVEAVREVLLPLARRETRIAVALPDAAGHIFLLDLDTPFRKRQEGEDLIRWRLKDRLPAGLKDFALDFQVLEAPGSGSKRVLTSIIARDLLAQYEELLAKAGFAAAVIDFHSPNVYNAFRSRVDLGTDFMLISVDDNQLSILGFENLKLDYYRAKTVPANAERIFQELSRTMVGYRHDHSTLARSSIYLHTSWEQPEELRDAVRSVYDREIELLPSPLAQLVNSGKLALAAPAANSMAAALGVAERMIQRVRR